MEKRITLIAVTIIFLSWLAVLFVGFLSMTPMIGDEVTHYYMLKTQAERLPVPCFEAHIPLGSSGEGRETRFYPHAFVWHYVGAILFRLTGSVAVVQVYQSLFLLQFLLVVFMMVEKLGCGKDEGGTIALLAVASLPMTLIFSVAFYQDVPAAAQAITAFYFLMRKRWFAATLFMALSISMKENMLLLLPSFMIWLSVVTWERGWRKWVFTIVTSGLIVLLSCSIMAWSLREFGHGTYYPFDALKVLINKVRTPFPYLCPKVPAGIPADSPVAASYRLQTTFYDSNVISTNPGDLRNPVSWLIYPGGLFWILLAAGIVGLCVKRNKTACDRRTDTRDIRWLGLAGVSYIIFTAGLLWNAPDARFFFPGVVLCMIPLCVYAAKIRGVGYWIWLVVFAAVLQAGVVLHKTYAIRHVPAGVYESITYLRDNPPTPNRVFMYPEGNYRLFPCPHEWYLLPKYQLREFWKANNDRRIELLREHGIGAIVVKKHLIGKIDPEMNNLGIYPDYFIVDIDADKRFVKVLENKNVIIYRLPPVLAGGKVQQ